MPESVFMQLRLALFIPKKSGRAGLPGSIEFVYMPLCEPILSIADRRQNQRTELRERRAGLTPGARIAAAEGVARSLEQLPQFLDSAFIAGYWASAGELSLHAAVSRLLRRGQTYCLPMIQPQRDLSFAAWRPGATLVTNRYGIPEPDVAFADSIAPVALDLVLLPLLGFNRDGHRLGFGGGFYDRSFAFLQDRPRPGKPLLVGIGYSLQELPELTGEVWDVRMDFVATERELIACTR